MIGMVGQQLLKAQGPRGVACGDVSVATYRDAPKIVIVTTSSQTGCIVGFSLALTRAFSESQILNSLNI